MNKKVMDALEAVFDETKDYPAATEQVAVSKENLDILIAWAMGQRIHLQYGEEVGLKVSDDPDDGDQPSRGTIVGFSGRDGVIVAAGEYEHLYYERRDVYTL
jgi:hypothetical protein